MSNKLLEAIRLAVKGCSPKQIKKIIKKIN
jgi:hypothetical protein